MARIIDCEDDRCPGINNVVWYCVDCISYYCDDCWDEQLPHKTEKKDLTGTKHERTRPEVAAFMQDILEPPEDVGVLEQLHVEDASSRWFKIDHSTGTPVLEVLAQHRALTSTSESQITRIPQLVSFVGLTDAGKSTLVKLLIESGRRKRFETGGSAFTWPSPVVGSPVHNNVPTSAGVNLYEEPLTAGTEQPMLFADSEGLGAGGKIPFAQHADISRARTNVSARENLTILPIRWAEIDKTRARSYIAERLYPRLLYTFSDCIVFVHQNAKTLESSVLSKLLEWSAALDRPKTEALPHCIVVLNVSTWNTGTDRCSADVVTRDILETLSSTLDPEAGDNELRDRAQHWRELNFHISTVEDLVLRHYRSFQVVRVPSGPPYEALEQQIDELYEVIKSRCAQSRAAKKAARSAMSEAELGKYMELGFDHFVSHFDLPFDFTKASLSRDPMSSNYAGHVAEMLICRDRQRSSVDERGPGQVRMRPAMYGKELLLATAGTLASSALLDCVRRVRGRFVHFHEAYAVVFEKAAHRYLQYRHECDGHVDEDVSRRPGPLRSDSTVECAGDSWGSHRAAECRAHLNTAFLPHLKILWIREMLSLQLDYDRQALDPQRNVSPMEVASSLHLRSLKKTSRVVGTFRQIISHSTCLCCLTTVPEVLLQCGHVLCRSCVLSYAKLERWNATLYSCPLDGHAGQASPDVIPMIPSDVGIRVLSLDDGGAGAVAQTAILKAIEDHLGGHLPIRKFFDLIIGKGTGGFLGVALALEEGSIEHCQALLTDVCEQLFGHHASGISGLSSMLRRRLMSWRRRTPDGLSDTLRASVAADEPMYGSTHLFDRRIRVAIISESHGVPELLANYRRPDRTCQNCTLRTADGPSSELTLSEVMLMALQNGLKIHRRTLSARKSRNSQTSAPDVESIAINEAKAIWPDIEMGAFTLSIGAKRVSTTKQRAPQLKERRSRLSLDVKITEQRQYDSLDQPLQTHTRLCEESDEAQTPWLRFRTEEGHSADGTGQIVRIHLDPEGLADSSHTSLLRSIASQNISEISTHLDVNKLGRALVATCFYLDVRAVEMEGDLAAVQGCIRCRFEHDPKDVMALGRTILPWSIEDRESFHQSASNVQPFFKLGSDADTSTFRTITLPHEKIKRMSREGIFEPIPIAFRVRKGDLAMIEFVPSSHRGRVGHAYTISKFPRSFPVDQQPRLAKSLAMPLHPTMRVEPDTPCQGVSVDARGHDEDREDRSSLTDTGSLGGGSSTDTYWGAHGLKGRQSDCWDPPSPSTMYEASQHGQSRSSQDLRESFSSGDADDTAARVYSSLLPPPVKLPSRLAELHDALNETHEGRDAPHKIPPRWSTHDVDDDAEICLDISAGKSQSLECRQLLPREIPSRGEDEVLLPLRYTRQT